MCFQQDETTSHSTLAKRALLHENVSGGMILTLNDINANNPLSLDQLKANIRDAIVEILPDMCRKVIQNNRKRRHTLRKDESSVVRQAMPWNPLDGIGRRKGKPCETCRRTVERECKN